MRYYWIISTLFLLGSFSALKAQDTLFIRGVVTDSMAKDPLEAVAIIVTGSEMGTYSKSEGEFKIRLRHPLPVILRFSYIGYENKELEISPGYAGEMLSIQMSPRLQELTQIVVQSNSLREKFNSTNTSVESIDARDAQVLPALFGEVDIIKTLQLKPGISSGSEGSSSLFVRGGNGDQNLVLLDGVNIYNPSHLFGFFSTFNNDALQSVDVFKGGFPAQYGGRLSSILDIKTKAPNPDKLSGSGGLGIISSRLMLEGPLFSDKVSFLISARRTYIDVFTELANKINEDKTDFSPIPKYRFYDLNGKLSAKINKKNTLSFSGYMGADIFGFNNDLFKVNFDWGNKAGSVQWNHSFSNRMYANTTLFVSDYNYNIVNSVGDFDFNLGSQISDLGLGWNFFLDAEGGHFIQGGIQVINHQFEIGRFQAGSLTDNVEFSAGSTPSGQEYAAFISDRFSPWERITVNLGLRYSGFASHSKFYNNLEPRFAVNAGLTNRLNLKSSYTRMNQYIHLVSNNGLSLPTDIWYPTTDRVKPQKSDQIVLGLQYLIKPSLMLTHEYYYKSMANQIELKDYAQIFANDDLENEFTFGNGYAYGTEVGVEKKSGRWTGWIGYTLAWVRRGDFADIEGGRYFPPKYDRRHDLSVVSSYRFNDKWTVSATFVFGTGDKAWLPEGRFYLQDIPGSQSYPVVPIYGNRNTVTIPSYHRGDLSIVRSFKAKWGSHDINLSVYNIYNRRNPYFLYLDSELQRIPDGPEDFEVPVKVTAKQASLFPIIPSISWNFKF